MTTYNHEKYIGQTIDSVLMQETDFEYELVIGEDCSTTDPPGIVKNYQQRLSWYSLHYYEQENLGMMRNAIDTYGARRPVCCLP